MKYNDCEDIYVGDFGLEPLMYAPTFLSLADKLYAVKVRLGIGRERRRVTPGLYAVGDPGCDAPVLAGANYKLSFDTLRKNLGGLDCWLLILDTKGVNVWCAAGAGVFNTELLVKGIKDEFLSKGVPPMTLILPQLSAPGVNALDAERRTGFRVFFGPVRAADIRAFIDAGGRASTAMRLTRFTLKDRLALIPMELIPAVKKTAPVFGALYLTNKYATMPFDRRDAVTAAGAIAAGTVAVPALLPFIPAKAFAAKGWLVGLLWTAANLCAGKRFAGDRRAVSAGQFLLLPAVSAYLALNFTGAAPYTSQSGVEKEMKRAMPLILGAGLLGAALTLGAHFWGGRKR